MEKSGKVFFMKQNTNAEHFPSTFETQGNNKSENRIQKQVLMR